MDLTADHAWLVLLLGILSTTQTHLAKALERQGIATWDLVRARRKRGGCLRRNEEEAHQWKGPLSQSGRRRIPIIYTMGLILNHTTFLYHLLIAPLGAAIALYTGMYGIGLVALLLYSTWVMKEEITRLQMAGVAAILAGALVIGLEGIARPPLDMGQMSLAATAAAVLLLLGLCLVLVIVGLRNGTPHPIGLAFGLAAGACGSLDPFLKGVGQSAGPGSPFLPGSTGGWAVLVFSFLVGEAAVLLTQWGFYRRAKANLLVPVYNCTYVAVPVLLQAFLLPGYRICWSTLLGLGLIMAGFVCMRALRLGSNAAVGSDLALEGSE
jgi:multidrug transporter EmrE-like cation transporter